MIRTLLLLSLLRRATCLMERTLHGMKNDIADDDFNYTANLENVDLQNDEMLDEMLGNRSEANTVCRTYERSFGSQRLEINASFAVDDDVEVNASLIQALGKELKLACFGATWEGLRCWKIASAMRHAVWPLLKSHTGISQKFAHLRSHENVPPIKTFRRGGGNAADIQCRGGNGPAHLYYRHIFKSGGLAIQKNLAILSHKNSTQFVDDAWGREGYCKSYMKKKLLGVLPKPVLFTFVRNPMDKFIAGYKEIASRGLLDDVRGTNPGSIAHAKYFLDNVFHGSCDNGHVLLQIQSMMGSECGSRFDFIGNLENLLPQWEALGIHAGCTEPLHWPREFQHKSDLNDKGAEQAMHTALAENGGQLMKALCLWLLPDYVAFGYSLPEECKQHDQLM